MCGLSSIWIIALAPVRTAMARSTTTPDRLAVERRLAAAGEKGDFADDAETAGFGFASTLAHRRGLN
jgi:hypothetical protein